MSTINKVQLSLSTTIQAMGGGTDAVQGIGQDYLLTFGTVYSALSFNQGDLLTLIFTDQATQYETQIGAGYVSGVQFTFCMTFNDKVYGLGLNSQGQSNVYCCAVDQPTVWNDPNAIGNGYVTLTNWYNGGEQLVAIAPFQGNLAFYSRYTIQVWSIDPDLDNWQKIQTLENIGTVSGNSVGGLGDLDNIFLSDSGFRSLRVRYADRNGTQNDIGSPIDEFVQEMLLGLTDAQKQLCCKATEPSSGRYWCFIPNAALNGGYIWVLSFFPSNKIIAWSRYTPIDNNGATFVPEKFVIFAGQVYCTAGGFYYQYGGSNNNTYDTTVASIQIPFYDEKRPGHKKNALAVDVDVDDTCVWTVVGSPDWINNVFQDIGAAGQATFDNGVVGYEDVGTHFSFGLLSAPTAAPAKVSSIIFYYTLAEENS